jgi:hypothetical protein
MADSMLLGSVNLTDAEEVFRTVAAVSGTTIAAIPDGERGRRAGWIGAQVPLLMGNPLLTHDVLPPGSYGAGDEPRILFRPREGVDPGEVRLSFPYAEDAIASSRLLERLQSEGAVPQGVRLQVSIPSAIATVVAFIAPDCQAALLGSVEASLADEVARIAEAIPHDRVAVQWDVAVEFNYIELQGSPGPFSRRELIDSLVRLGNAVPADIPLGYHLCYGDAPEEPGVSKGRHFVEPADAGLLTEFANAIVAGVSRQVAWVHMPVPIERDDDAYFAPLADLHLPQGTRLFLGLVHEEDGIEGAQRRIAAAANVVRGFGVATECGLQNEPRGAIARILETQRDAVVPAS